MADGLKIFIDFTCYYLWRIILISKDNGFFILQEQTRNMVVLPSMQTDNNSIIPGSFKEGTSSLYGTECGVKL